MSRYDYDGGKVDGAKEILSNAKSKLSNTASDFQSALSEITNASKGYLSINASILTELPNEVSGSIDAMISLISEKQAKIEEYQKKELFEKALASIGMGITKIGEGIATAGESILDAGVSIAGWSVGFASETFKESCGEFVKKDHVGDFFADQYENGSLKFINDSSVFSHTSTAANVFKGVGVATGYILAAGATGGALGAVGVGGMSATAGVGSIGINAAVAGVGGLGSGTQSGLQSGLDYNQAMFQGAKQGAIQAGTVFVAGKAAQKLSNMRATRAVSSAAKSSDDAAEYLAKASDEIEGAYSAGKLTDAEYATKMGNAYAKADKIAGKSTETFKSKIVSKVDDIKGNASTKVSELKTNASNKYLDKTATKIEDAYNAGKLTDAEYATKMGNAYAKADKIAGKSTETFKSKIVSKVDDIKGNASTKVSELKTNASNKYLDKTATKIEDAYNAGKLTDAEYATKMGNAYTKADKIAGKSSETFKSKIVSKADDIKGNASTKVSELKTNASNKYLDKTATKIEDAYNAGKLTDAEYATKMGNAYAKADKIAGKSTETFRSKIVSKADDIKTNASNKYLDKTSTKIEEAYNAGKLTDAEYATKMGNAYVNSDKIANFSAANTIKVTGKAAGSMIKNVSTAAATSPVAKGAIFANTLTQTGLENTKSAARNIPEQIATKDLPDTIVTAEVFETKNNNTTKEESDDSTPSNNEGSSTSNSTNNNSEGGGSNSVSGGNATVQSGGSSSSPSSKNPVQLRSAEIEQNSKIPTESKDITANIDSELKPVEIETITPNEPSQEVPTDIPQDTPTETPSIDNNTNPTEPSINQNTDSTPSNQGGGGISYPSRPSQNTGVNQGNFGTNISYEDKIGNSPNVGEEIEILEVDNSDSSGLNVIGSDRNPISSSSTPSISPTSVTKGSNIIPVGLGIATAAAASVAGIHHMKNKSEKEEDEYENTNEDTSFSYLEEYKDTTPINNDEMLSVNNVDNVDNSYQVNENKNNEYSKYKAGSINKLILEDASDINTDNITATVTPQNEELE